MVAKESIDLIRDYIKSRDGAATKSEVVRYMQNDVPRNLRLSRDTVVKVIENMQDVKILKGERKGQAHRLLIVDEKDFNSILKELSQIENFIDKIDEETKMQNIIDMIDQNAPVQDIIDKMDQETRIEEKNERTSLPWSSLFSNQFEYQFFIAVSMLLLHSSVRMNQLVKSQKNLQILREKHDNIILKMANRSSKMLSWNLLEIELDDLKDIKTYSQFSEWFRDKV